MIKYTHELIEEYKDFIDPKGKIRREVENGRFYPIIRGLYETDPNVTPLRLAQYIYGPSYISFETALGYHGLIKINVYTVLSSTFNKRKRKEYKTFFGLYAYRDVPMEVFPLAVEPIQIDGYSYIIATKEKALCDKLYTMAPFGGQKALKSYLFEYLKINRDRFKKLDKALIEELAPKYRSHNLMLLSKLIEGESI